MKIAKEMDYSGDSILLEERCFDGKESSCRNLKTLISRVYHPLLQKQVALAVME